MNTNIRSRLEIRKKKSAMTKLIEKEKKEGKEEVREKKKGA